VEGGQEGGGGGGGRRGGRYRAFVCAYTLP
jgi:hypothetical protein